MKILLCMLSVTLCTAAIGMEQAKNLMASEREMFPKYNNITANCSNDDIAHVEACSGIACFLMVPVCGVPAAIASLCCFFDATKRFKKEERFHHQVDPENND